MEEEIKIGDLVCRRGSREVYEVVAIIPREIYPIYEARVVIDVKGRYMHGKPTFTWASWWPRPVHARDEIERQIIAEEKKLLRLRDLLTKLP
jgi:hypothetical protein